MVRQRVDPCNYLSEPTSCRAGEPGVAYQMRKQVEPPFTSAVAGLRADYRLGRSFEAPAESRYDLLQLSA